MLHWPVQQLTQALAGLTMDLKDILAGCYDLSKDGPADVLSWIEEEVSSCCLAVGCTCW